jgi:hypothetical protein
MTDHFCHACTKGDGSPPLSHTRLHRLLAPWLNRAGASCRHFIDLASARLDRRLTLSETLRHSSHWLICRYCRQVEPQYARLITLIRSHDYVYAIPPSCDMLKRFSDSLEKAVE